MRMTTSGEAQRLFIAVPVPDDVRMALAAALDPVRRRVRGGRWSAPETWHLTLRFLGDTLPDAVPGIRDGVQATAARQSPFAAALGRAGAFERRGGRVVWVGLEQGDAEVAMLAAALAARLAPADVHLEAIRVHLTIARDAPDGLVPALDAALRAARPSEPDTTRVGLGVPPASASGRDPLGWMVDRLVLYRSVLGNRGAVHTPLLEVPLGP
jgi:2'-5' RNA ligase